MQKLPVYLYTNLFDVTLDLDNNKEINQIMYQRPLKIQKGVKNTVQLQFKNSDQKRLDVSSSTFVLNVYETSENRSLILSKNIDIIDTGSSATTYVSKGLGQVVFTASDTLDMESKAYNFSVVMLEEDGTLNPTYSNTYYDVPGILELKEEVFPAAKPSIEVVTFQRVYNSDVGKLWWEYNTGNVRIYPDSQNRNGTLSTAFYMRNFRGTVYLEGTLDNSPSTFGHYAVLQSRTYTGFSGVDYMSANGIFTHLRVRYIPAKNPNTGFNDDTSYAGNFDKVLLRS